MPILYDADCGFCRVMLAWMHASDRRGRLLPGGRPLALLPAVAPRLTERAYRLVADRRSTLGR